MISPLVYVGLTRYTIGMNTNETNVRAFKVVLAVSAIRPEWSLMRIGSFFAIRHISGMNHTGSARYIAKVWNERFAAPHQKVAELR